MRLRLFTALLAAALAAAQTTAPAPAPAPAATPLPLPADHASTCTAEAMLDVTSNVRGCFKAIWRGEESGEPAHFSRGRERRGSLECVATNALGKCRSC